MEKEEFDRLSPEEQKAHLARIERFIMAPGHWPEVNSVQLGILLRAGLYLAVVLVLTAGVTLVTLVLLRVVKGAFIGYLWAKDEMDRGS